MESGCVHTNSPMRLCGSLWHTFGGVLTPLTENSPKDAFVTLFLRYIATLQWVFQNIKMCALYPPVVCI